MEEPKPVPPAFKIGDTVRLKSGGPAMTVKILKSSVYQDEKGNLSEGFVGFIVCTWFDALTTELKTEVFKQAMLMSCSSSNNDETVIPVVVNKHI
jgi:uncharacterized protein YodC (DUF2158 family)